MESIHHMIQTGITFFQWVFWRTYVAQWYSRVMKVRASLQGYCLGLERCIWYLKQIIHVYKVLKYTGMASFVNLSTWHLETFFKFPPVEYMFAVSMSSFNDMFHTLCKSIANKFITHCTTMTKLKHTGCIFLGLLHQPFSVYAFM